MKYPIKVVLSLIALVLFAQPASALTPGELAAKLQESYDKTLDLKAGFTQMTVVRAMNIKKEGRGTLLIKKPGLLRYTYTRPERQELIVKGDDLIMYTPSTNQVIRKKLDRAVMDKTPSTFLAGLGSITGSFTVRFPKGGEKDKLGRYMLELVPKGDKMGIEHIDLTLDPENFNILAFSFTEAAGNTNAIYLDNIKINKGIKDGAFAFQIPGGANLISE